MGLVVYCVCVCVCVVGGAGEQQLKKTHCDLVATRNYRGGIFKQVEECQESEVDKV